MNFCFKLTESTNQFVTVEFDALFSSVQCTFKQPMTSGNEKSCSIVYGPGENCTNLLQRSGNRTSTHDIIVTINNLIIPNIWQENKFCSIITASAGPYVANIEKVFYSGKQLWYIWCTKIGMFEWWSRV